MVDQWGQGPILAHKGSASLKLALVLSSVLVTLASALLYISLAAGREDTVS